MPTSVSVEYGDTIWGDPNASWGGLHALWGGPYLLTITFPSNLATVEAHPGHSDPDPNQRLSSIRTRFIRQWSLYQAFGLGTKRNSIAYPAGEILAEIVPEHSHVVAVSGGGFSWQMWGQPLWGSRQAVWGGHIIAYPAGYIGMPDRSAIIEATSGMPLISTPASIFRVRSPFKFMPFYPARFASERPLSGDIQVEMARSVVELAVCAGDQFYGVMWGNAMPYVAWWGRKFSGWGGIPDVRVGAHGEAVTGNIAPGVKTYV